MLVFNTFRQARHFCDKYFPNYPLDVDIDKYSKDGHSVFIEIPVSSSFLDYYQNHKDEFFQFDFSKQNEDFV